MKFLDRLMTIVLTVVLTSAVWILFGGSMMNRAADIGVPGAENMTDRSESDDGSDPGGDEESPPPGTSVNSGEPGAATGRPPADPVGPLATQLGGLRIPVANIDASQLSDTFFDDRDGGTRTHEAIDIMAEEGRAVIAAAPGKISKLHMSGPGGNSIYVRSGDRRTIYYYAHLANYAPGLKEGQTIRTGQRLGTVGSTGNADPSAPHLHFAIMETTPDARWWEPSNAINPYPLLKGEN